MAFQLPSIGFVFWPVSNGDSTTCVVSDDTVIQIDLNHLTGAEDDDEPTWPVVDELVRTLPKKNGKPFLSVFTLSHPDQDHCRGFERLLDEVEIGELWFSPRIFREYNKDLCDEAAAFKKEAERRVKKTIEFGDDPGDGNRIRLFGVSALLDEDAFDGFPESNLQIPGTSFTVVNGDDYSGEFRAFVHAPFKEDVDADDRNDTSLAFQLTIEFSDHELRCLLFGDLSYPVLKKIFDRSDKSDLEWNVLLAPHHCSKSAMYWKDEGAEEATLHRDIVDNISNSGQSPTYVVSSSRPFPIKDQKDADPPHLKARRQYEEAAQNFVCTMETPNDEEPKPVVFELTDNGIRFRGKVAPATSATAVANKAQGGDNPPSEPTTYGRH